MKTPCDCLQAGVRFGAKQLRGKFWHDDICLRTIHRGKLCSFVEKKDCGYVIIQSSVLFIGYARSLLKIAIWFVALFSTASCDISHIGVNSQRSYSMVEVTEILAIL